MNGIMRHSGMAVGSDKDLVGSHGLAVCAYLCEDRLTSGYERADLALGVDAKDGCFPSQIAAGFLPLVGTPLGCIHPVMALLRHVHLRMATVTLRRPGRVARVTFELIQMLFDLHGSGQDVSFGQGPELWDVVTFPIHLAGQHDPVVLSLEVGEGVPPGSCQATGGLEVPVTVSALDLDGLLALAVEIAVAMDVVGGVAINAVHARRMVEIHLQIVVVLSVQLGLLGSIRSERGAITVGFHHAQETDTGPAAAVMAMNALLRRNLRGDLMPNGIPRLVLGDRLVSRTAQAVVGVHHVTGGAAAGTVVAISPRPLIPQMAPQALVAEIVINGLFGIRVMGQRQQLLDRTALLWHITVLVLDRLDRVDGVLLLLRGPEVPRAADDARHRRVQ